MWIVSTCLLSMCVDFSYRNNAQCLAINTYPSIILLQLTISLCILCQCILSLSYQTIKLFLIFLFDFGVEHLSCIVLYVN